jgi:DNA processing protein
MDERGLLDMMITRLPGLSFSEKILLCESFEDESDLIRKTAADIEVLIKRRLPAFWDINVIRTQAEKDAKTARLRGINTVSWNSPAYPPLLREIYDPPTLLYFRGCLPNPEAPLVAVVGTRKPSPRASAQAYEIARDLGRGGLSVVSGLALGIDATAHRGNIDGGAPTIAVLGSGADEIYPSSNRGLARRVLETGGALITEYPPGTGPRKWNFPARNRIISGLSRGVLIAEAPEKSGALITARFALEQGRDIWVASAGVVAIEHTGHVAAGTEKLAGEGAPVIHSAAEIFGAWNIETAVDVPEEQPGLLKGECGAALADSLARSLGVEL